MCAIALCQMGLDKAPTAVGKIIELSKGTGNSKEKIRRTAAECLGTLSREDPLFPDAVNNLCHMIQYDSDGQVLFPASSSKIGKVRLLACFSLVCLAKFAGNSILKTLEIALNDSNKYVRGYAIYGLKSVATPEATEILVRSLLTSQWCYLTDPKCPF